MELCNLSPSYVRAIAPYQPGKPIAELAREMHLAEEDIVKLASNENPLGASPRALAAMENVLMEIARYPDGNGFLLKSALADKHCVELNQIVLGNGSNDLLELAARAFLAPGTSAIYSQYAFAVYPLATQAAGARGIETPARDYGHDLKAMLEAISDDTRIIFIANPNNPTGTLLGGAELEHFLDQVPHTVLVVLDEAYTEYLPEAQRSHSLAWLKKYSNLLITRTFSKAYGLAGMRVGFALGHPEVIGLLNRVRQPFNVNSLAQAAAVAAMQDEAFLEECVEINRSGMEQITTGLTQMGLDYIPSAGNFVAVKVGNAAAVNHSLLEQGVIVRPIASYGMPEFLRVSIGLKAENVRFLQALEHSLAEQSQP
ncbi:MAG: histidinol-phosphate transaminase [Sulfurimicrobium sp.]|jgi:histidinol-phosphate aminotransferase|nr:histidinol-phosphate transaminase [Sulfurimicrobium sp.]MDP2962206.1 histidinol-phosphate transaminase [Sulfurimicrobium sp.]MDZ7654901.1 histidinol-phosphate transaminase [Sulfurimicrobium sp.]